MFKLRTLSIRPSRAGMLMAIFAAFAGVFAVTTTSARAADVPFWEAADMAAAKSKKSRMAGNSYKSYKAKAKLGGYAEATEPKKKRKGVRVAALDSSAYDYNPSYSKKSLSGGGVRWVASSGCLASGLKSVIYSVAANFGPVTVSSTCRSAGRNRAVGGARKSKHLSGNAADFRVHGNIRGVYAYLRSTGGVGGLKHYGGGLFHIDNGDRRTW